MHVVFSGSFKQYLEFLNHKEYFRTDFNVDIMVGCETHFFFMEIENELKNLIDEYFSNSEYRIIETVFRGEKGTKVLEIYVDNVNGIIFDEITGINKELSELIDSKLIINDISNLIVSSPGAERSIKYLWQLHKHSGRTLEIEMNDGEKFDGKLISVSEDDSRIMVEIAVHEKGKKNVFMPREINFKDIKDLRVKISFSKK